MDGWMDGCCDPNLNKKYIPDSTYSSTSYFCTTSEIFSQLAPSFMTFPDTCSMGDRKMCAVHRWFLSFSVDRLVSVADLSNTARMFPYKSTLSCPHKAKPRVRIIYSILIPCAITTCWFESSRRVTYMV